MKRKGTRSHMKWSIPIGGVVGSVIYTAVGNLIFNGPILELGTLPTQCKWEKFRAIGRERGYHTRWIDGLRRYGPCIVFHSIKAAEVDLI